MFSCQKKATPLPASDYRNYDKAYAFLSTDQDSAFYYFNKVVTESPDSQQVALAYTTMAMLQSDAGDHFGCQESLTSSLRYLNARDAKGRNDLANNYNELGMSSTKLRNYTDAISYYDQALSTNKDPAFVPTILNNQGNAYRHKRKYAQALKLYQMAIRSKGTTAKVQARILTNMATTQWLCDPTYPAAPELRRALAIRQHENDLWGQNSSYAHLADYYMNSMPDSALDYAGRMYSIAQRLHSADDQLEALQKLIKVSPPQLTKIYFTRYDQLNDSLQTVRNAAKNQFALIRYNTERHKADKLRLQKENSEKNYQIAKQWAAIFIILTMAIAGVIIFSQRSRRKQVETEAKAKQDLQEYQLSTSKKIHDVVANGLYQVMAEIEHQPELDKEILATRIDILYKQSRAISYNRSLEFNYQDLDREITDMLTSFSSPRMTIITAGNEANTWNSVRVHMFNEIKNVLLELMINMKKHSRADRVVLRFQRDTDRLHIWYQDNGVGLPQPTKFGNGLTNTGNRIRTMNGSITFGSNNGAGLLIQMFIPLA
ncbi:ATP-binding protein [Mucilaginibacter daejeonensis]|uniref:tetratricopeptide repeat-containing sensor histidine kinase n=1 Tax=Mucilaginibacter daejeonensis TaxID=398049 RepID=UPI001D1797CC|nr:tetratricopeptide repeat protein [Mucilaginibacter daejeonensis]UEG51461.1 ATP-binding protein [Mucilaginibacter daejeonensis]